MWEFVIGIPLIMHGFANSAGFFEAWFSGSLGFSDQPWILGGTATMKSPLGRLFGLVWLLSTIGLVAAGAAVFLDTGWWRSLAIAASALSFAIIVLWWRAVPPGAKFGAMFDLGVIIALVGPWSTKIVEAIH